MSGQAERIDPATGTRHVVGFVGDDELVFMARHEPATSSGSGVVICSSIFIDALRKYRMEHALARALAARGVAAQRFHYRGSGHSDGASTDLTWEGMVEDARHATDELRRRAAPGSVGFVGTRFGGLVAAACAARTPGAPLVLIEPVLEAERFFNEGLRADKVAGLRSATAATNRSMAELVAELDDAGSIDLLGHDLGKALFDSARQIKLLDLLTSGPPRPMLFVQLGEPGRLKVPIARVVDGLRDHGCTVDVELVDEPTAWWFEADEDLPDDRITVPVTEWLARHVYRSEPEIEPSGAGRA